MNKTNFGKNEFFTCMDQFHVVVVQISKYICETLAWVLLMKRPGSPSQEPKKKKMKHKMIQEQKLSDRFSRSLLANILDLDDFRSLRSAHNFRHASTRSASSCYSDCQSSHTTNSFRSSELHRSSTTSGREHWDTPEASEHIHRKTTPVKVSYGTAPRKSVAASLLEEILSELRLLTNKMKRMIERRRVAAIGSLPPWSSIVSASACSSFSRSSQLLQPSARRPIF